MREHRLARARLAGDHVQPRMEQQLGALDQQQVLDPQLGEHSWVLAGRPDGAGKL